ncbi:isochorismatase family hydrolase [Coccidioides immitis RS]|uniref:nicotinamidase n=2 Tax=Coccidioides immitis TaxID=5501 RepID=J3KDK6_COCIM|nr:isochorismatase family hydrolase [Coccidioides immitis RS]EAS33455.3 isochorismatase family hydrolase [Coccidioides immitis RS]TPX22647.1 NAD(+) salvage pathway protein [Coccidioides immitis]
MDATDANNGFRPALIVVDMQEDFCYPNPLGVRGGRELVPLINELIGYPGFVLRIATQDFHPATHISFATNHPAPNNKPFESYITMKNPAPGKESITMPQRLWPVHCVQHTPGAELLPGIEKEKFDLIVRKGMDERVEMYSAFADAFGNTDCVASGGASADLETALRENQVTDVFVVGVAGSYCVKFTAIDAMERGFNAYVIEEGTRCVDEGDVWNETKAELAGHGVKVVRLDGPEVGMIKRSV